MGFFSRQKVTKVERVANTYDFQEYTEFKDMVGYLGFISPKGTFYRVRKMGQPGIGHGDWAMKFLYQNMKRDTLDLDPNIEPMYVCESDEFNFTMVFEGNKEGTTLAFAPGKNGLTKEQYGVINYLTKGQIKEEELNLYR